MKKLWEKTKKTVTVGVARIDEKVNDKKIEDDPEFIDRESKLSEIDKCFTSLFSSLNDVNGTIKRTGVILQTIGSTYNNALPEDDKNKNLSQSASTVGNNVKTFADNANSYYIPTIVLAPLSLAIEEVKKLKRIRDKSKKNHILLNQEENHLKDARAKVQNVEKHEESTQRRRDKYNKYHDEFITGTTTLYERRSDICTAAYTAGLFYFSSLNLFTQRQVQSNMPQCTIDALGAKFPSAENPPPAISAVVNAVQGQC